MGNSIFAQAANFIHERRGNRRWRAVVICLAVIVAGATAWGLSKKGQALTHADDVLDCRLVVHEHSEECYDENGNLICGIADYVFHEHDESCYNADEELVCQLPEVIEHVHTDDCFAFEKILICGKEETTAAEDSGNSDADDVGDYNVVNAADIANMIDTADTVNSVSVANVAAGATELICGQEEHTHNEGCYETVTVPSGEEQVIETLTCTQEVHTHGDSCFDEDGNLVCTKEEHSHGSDCYEYETVPSGEVEVSKVLTCTQEEHIHSAECYSTDTATDIVDSETTEPDSDTSEPDTVEPNPAENPETAHVHTDACYMTVRKLICAEMAAHIHDEGCYDNNGNPVCGAPYVESVETHVHDEECFKPGDDDDTDYTKSFSNDDIVVTAVYKKSANIPVEAKLNVEQIIVEENNLDEYKQRLETVLEKDETPAMLLNLRFSTDDELFVPEDTINLTVEFKNDNFYAEGDTAKVASVTENGAETIINANIDDTHSVTFDVDGLTDFAFIVYEENDAHTLTYEGEDYIVTVALGEETTVPEDAELVVEQITLENNPEAYAACLARLEETEGVLDENEMAALLLNIGIYAEGNEIVPDETMEVSVQFLNREIYFEGDAVKAAHFTNDSTELLTASAIDENVSTTFTVNALAGFAFITDAEIRTLTSAGEDFIVTVRFSTAAMIPEDAQLVARRITEESDPEEFTNREDKLQDEISDELIALGALFDISFYGADGMEIEPQDVVDVKIQLLDKKDVEEADSVKVAHFVEDEESAEESIEIIEDADVSKDGEGSLSTTFQTDKFSPYAIVVNGGVTSETTLRKAFKMAQDGRDSGTVKLEADIVFVSNASTLGDADDKNGAIPLNGGKSVTLDLNGHTITVISEDSYGGSVTLVDIAGTLFIKDSNTENRSIEKTPLGPSSGRDNYEGPYDYDETNHKLNWMACNVTESEVINADTGETSETTYKYKVSGHGAIVGSEGNGNVLLWVANSNAKLSIDDGVIVGENGNRAVKVDGGTLELGDCYLVRNTAPGMNGGGAVYSSGGTINISEGTVIADNEAWQGGGIFIRNNGKLNMSGGYVTNNLAVFGKAETDAVDADHYRYGGGGGGIYLEASKINMTGGYVTANKTYTGGGGIVLTGIHTESAGPDISGGHISSNYCLGGRGDGAGISLYDKSCLNIESIEGSKVYITNNEVRAQGDWGGAGIFVGENSKANLWDTLITNNTSDGFGGGLSGCSTGRIYNSSIHGAAIFDNTALGTKKSGYQSSKQADKTYTENNPAFWLLDKDGKYMFQDCFTALYTELENTMLGDGSENWDGSIDGERIDRKAGVWKSSYIAGLTAYPSEADKRSAMNLANVYINGNYSVVHGAGIMCNGIMIIGQRPGEIEIISSIDLRATKRLEDSDGTTMAMKEGQFSFTIYEDEDCTIPVTTGANDANGNITFNDFLTFDLRRDVPEMSEDDKINTGNVYVFYIKEDDATADQIENTKITNDNTLYRLEVTVKKTDKGTVSNVKKFRDDITYIALYQKVGDNDWDPNPVYTNDNPSNVETKPTTVSLSNSNNKNKNSAVFVNKKTTVKKIEVEKKWDYPTPEEAESAKASIEYIVVALYKDEEPFVKDGVETEKMIAAEPMSVEEFKQHVEGHKHNHWETHVETEGPVYGDWKASWDGLEDDGSYDVKELYIQYTDGRCEPADWAFVPTYKYNNEGSSVGKVTIVNMPKTFGIEFTKVGNPYYDQDGNQLREQLQGAKFEIWAYYEETQSWEPLKFIHVSDGYQRYAGNNSDEDAEEDLNADIVSTQISTNREGILRISNLWWGKYIIKEVEAPVGYKPVHDHMVDYSGGTATQKVYCLKSNGDTDRVNTPWGVDENGNQTQPDVCPVFEELSELINSPADRGSDYFDYVNDVVIFTMIDPEDKYELPESGGPGTTNISILGAVLLFGIATLMYTTYRRRREGLRR